jgi:hypothetical protein
VPPKSKGATVALETFSIFFLSMEPAGRVPHNGVVLEPRGTVSQNVDPQISKHPTRTITHQHAIGAGVAVMSNESKGHRKAAADHLRASRKATTAEGKSARVKSAASEKELASNEEWLAGEKNRSRRRK